MRLVFLGRFLVVTALLGCRGNTPPSEPVLIGPDRAWPGDSLQFTAMSVDRNADEISYRFYWSDSVDTTWSGWLAPGVDCRVIRVFSDTGRYWGVARAKDATHESGLSDTLSVYVAEFAPSTPRKPAGRDTVPVGRAYNYVTYSFHPLLKDLSYRYKWGDSTGEWSQFVPSGTSYAAQLAFTRAGLTAVRAQAKDAREHVSDWSLAETVLVMDTFSAGASFGDVGRPVTPDSRR